MIDTNRHGEGMMKKVIVVWILAAIAAPALGAGSATAPLVTLKVPAAKLKVPTEKLQLLPSSTTVNSTQARKVTAPVQGQALAVPQTASPFINGVKPSDCVAKGGMLNIQGTNLLTSAGRSIALDDGNGTHVNLQTNSWSGTSISVKVPDDPRLQEGAGYWVAMEQSDHSRWLSNIDRSITICATTFSAAEPEVNVASPISGGGSLLDSEMPPPLMQNIQTAAIKEDVNVEPGELVVVSADMNEAQQLQQAAQSMGLGIKRRTPLRNLGLVVSVLRVPKGISVADALGQLRESMPKVWMDANHRYQLQADKAVRYASRTIAWEPRVGCGAGLHVGLIDTAVDVSHPLFKGHAIIQRSFLASGITPAPEDHGTATASILVAGAPTGLLPSVKLHVAAVFRSRNKKEANTTAEWVVRALDWLVGEKVVVINLSLGGPRNLLVEAAVQRVLKRGIVIVAAAGNGGADAEPMYPAAQPGVIAVTAIDANLKPYDRDNRGEYIAYAAPGVDVWVASPGGDGVYATGTSYAAPFVTAIIAATKWSGSGSDRAALDRLLQSKARDLGKPGRDNVFGWGLIQMPVECVRLARASQ
jgi:hypothetical protein